MALPFFYEPAVTAATHFTLSEDTSKHCIQVLRMKAGEQLQLADGKGNTYTATIVTPDKRHCTVSISQHVFVPAPPRRISIAIALLKNASRFEWFLEKATEMGVQDIVPLITKRTERQHFRHDRMNNIVIAAMLQSQQAWLPVLHQPITLEEAIAQNAATQKLVAHCEDAVKNDLAKLPISNNVQILIGPEGDFTPDEITLALQSGYQAVSLGNTRLRTETAGIVAAALLANL
jgi:16S rRNA (uracil1498-N3)-methyltransferase